MAFNDAFLRACRGEETPRTPVWYMRQAGRYQPEYRELRRRHSLLEICAQPDVCAEVTLLPVRQLDVDAAILFSDIMVPLAPMGVSFSLEKDIGPVIERPVRSAADIARLRALAPEEDLPHVLETIRILKRELAVPLIGFAGAPFTLASYLIEGAPSRDHILTKAFMFAEPALWRTLMDRLAAMVVSYMRAQAAAGAAAIQIFDSWVGSLAPADYARFVLPTMRAIFAGLADLGAPRIYFGVGAGELLPLWREVGADVVGVDWRVSLRAARERLGAGAALQGNLDPAALLAPRPELERRAADVLADARGAAADRGGGYIFNLGHGVPRQASASALRALTDFVHGWRA